MAYMENILPYETLTSFLLYEVFWDEYEWGIECGKMGAIFWVKIVYQFSLNVVGYEYPFL